MFYRKSHGSQEETYAEHIHVCNSQILDRIVKFMKSLDTKDLEKNLPQESVCCSSCWEFCQVSPPKGLLLLLGHDLPLTVYTQLLIAEGTQILVISGHHRAPLMDNMAMLLEHGHCCVYTAVNCNQFPILLPSPFLSQGSSC